MAEKSGEIEWGSAVNGFSRTRINSLSPIPPIPRFVIRMTFEHPLVDKTDCATILHLYFNALVSATTMGL